MTDEPLFDVKGGRHPVVEQALKRDRQPFVANDCRLEEASRLWLVTGPNMGGKSTFLRQNALIAILAQAGGFVPADSARSEEHTSELQSLMRTSYAVFVLKKKT